MTGEKFFKIVDNTPEYEPIFKIIKVPKEYKGRILKNEEFIAFRNNGRVLYHIRSKQLIPRDIGIENMEFVEYRLHRRQR